jgi:hypothetical protein
MPTRWAATARASAWPRRWPRAWAPRSRSRWSAIALQPRHADAHIALGAFHAEVIDKVGALIGGMTYGAKQGHRPEAVPGGPADQPGVGAGHDRIRQCAGHARRATQAAAFAPPWMPPNGWTWSWPGPSSELSRGVGPPAHSTRSGLPHSPQGSISVSSDSLANSGAKRSMMLLRIRAQRAVGDDAELHAAAIAQDRHAQADRTALRHPEQALLHRRPQEASFSRGPGTLVMTAVVLRETGSAWRPAPA